MIVIVAISLLLSCSEKVDETIKGNWKVENRFYEATYLVTSLGGKIVAKVLRYDDGTTKYHWDGNNPKYVFKNLKSKDGRLVDAVTGATTKNSKPNMEIKVLHEDTLNVITFFKNHSISEKWTRKKSQ